MNLDDAMELYNGVIAESGIVQSSSPTTEKPLFLGDEIKRIGIPDDALYLGTADDGLPILLNVNDPVPTNLTFISDDPHANNQMISMLSSFIGSMRGYDFGVISDSPLSLSPIPGNCVGVFRYSERGADDLILSMASWAHANKNQKRKVFLLVDDLVKLSEMDFDTIQNFRWLLFKGAERGVWVFSFSTPSGSLFNQLDGIGALRTKTTHVHGNTWEIQDGREVVKYCVPVVGSSQE